MDGGETLDEALEREVREEIGLERSGYDVVTSKTGYRYLYPKDVREKKLRRHGNHGQEQTYYLCRTKADMPPIDVNQKPPEFQAWRWIPPEEFDLDWLPDFKRDVYREVMKDFFNIKL